MNKGGEKIRYECCKTYLHHFNSVVDVCNALFNVNELNPVLSIGLVKAVTQDSNRTVRIHARHVSRSYPI